ncbi:hypothetical protein AB1N83_002336 [Pleurotus pulmonarius]
MCSGGSLILYRSTKSNLPGKHAVQSYQAAEKVKGSSLSTTVIGMMISFAPGYLLVLLAIVSHQPSILLQLCFSFHKSTSQAACRSSGLLWSQPEYYHILVTPQQASVKLSGVGLRKAVKQSPTAPWMSTAHLMVLQDGPAGFSIEFRMSTESSNFLRRKRWIKLCGARGSSWSAGVSSDSTCKNTTTYGLLRRGVAYLVLYLRCSEA